MKLLNKHIWIKATEIQLKHNSEKINLCSHTKQYVTVYNKFVISNKTNEQENNK